MVRLTRDGAILLGLFLALVAANVALWGFGLADHFPRVVQGKLFIVDAVCIGTFAMFISGRVPFSTRFSRSGRTIGPSEAETVEKLTE